MCGVYGACVMYVWCMYGVCVIYEWCMCGVVPSVCGVRTVCDMYSV